MVRERRDAVAAVLEVVALMRRRLPGLVVTFEPGWERRGNGTSARYGGGIVHHTATPSSLARPYPTGRMLIAGRSDLPGPLCNFGGPACTVERPSIVVVAAHPGNHAGASGGRSMGPLPVTTLFNPRVMGLEIDYAGSSPMLAGQMLVAQVWAGAVAEVVDGTVEYVRAHAETSITGKWDPGIGPGRTLHMPTFRAQAALTALMEADSMTAPISDANLTRIGQAAAAALLNADASALEGHQPAAALWSQDWNGTSPAWKNLNAALAELPARIADAVAARIADQLGPVITGALSGAAVNIVGADPQRIAVATADELARRAQE